MLKVVEHHDRLSLIGFKDFCQRIQLCPMNLMDGMRVVINCAIGKLQQLVRQRSRRHGRDFFITGFQQKVFFHLLVDLHHLFPQLHMDDVHRDGRKREIV